MIVKIDTDNGDCGLFFNAESNSFSTIVPPYDKNESFKKFFNIYNWFYVFVATLQGADSDKKFNAFLSENREYFEKTIEDIHKKTEIINPRQNEPGLRLVKNKE